MAAPLPDPRQFKSWEDAFQYPLPAVRKLEQQLRSNAAENRDKLRSLVGGSYRDLLGTAERICDMDETMQVIETTLGLTAAKSNSGVVAKIFANAAELNRERGLRSAEKHGLAAQLSVLRNCHSTMASLLKQDNQLFVAAKVLVLGRLVHKTLSQQAQAPPLVDGLRNKLATSRVKLLRSIDRSFSDPDLDGQVLISNMCAFSLATSSAPTDVLRHFLHIRLETIRGLVAVSENAQVSMIKAIRLFKTTLSATHAIFPTRLAEGLSKVKLQALFQDRDIQSLTELNLDMYGRWIPDEVRNFTPWPRHDELQKAGAEKITKSWIPAAMSSLKSTLKDLLGRQDEFEQVLKLREAILESHLTSTERITGAQSSDILDAIREALNERLIQLLKSEAGGVLALAGNISTVLAASFKGSDSATTSIWDLGVEDRLSDNGSFVFKEAVRQRIHGHDDATRLCSQSAEAWETAVTKARSLINSLRDQRWEDDILDTTADADDDLDLDSKQALLSEDDPATLREALDKALEESLVNFGNAMTELVEKNDDSASAIILIRVLRDLGQRTGAMCINFDYAKRCQPLYERIVAAVLEGNVRSYQTKLQSLAYSRHLPELALWEGHPALPSQPMACTFKLLRNVSQGMAGVGQDLWSPALVDSLKVLALGRLCELLQNTVDELQKSPTESAEVKAINGSINPVTNGVGTDASEEHKEKEEPESKEEDQAEPAVNGSDVEEAESTPQNGEQSGSTDIAAESLEQLQKDAVEIRTTKARQLLFDTYYLQKIFSTSTQQAPVTQDIQDVIDAAHDLAHFSSEHQKKVQRSANDYWRKTYLLFGLLV